MTRLGTNTKAGRRTLVALLSIFVIAVPGAGSAVAQPDPTDAQYDDTVTEITDEVGGAAETGQPPKDPEPSGLQKKVVGGLPFTGLDVIALMAVALALTSLGFALRRLTAERAHLG
jgi:hypothetical protein